MPRDTRTTEATLNVGSDSKRTPDEAGGPGRPRLDDRHSRRTVGSQHAHGHAIVVGPLLALQRHGPHRETCSRLGRWRRGAASAVTRPSALPAVFRARELDASFLENDGRGRARDSAALELKTQVEGLPRSQRYRRRRLHNRDVRSATSARPSRPAPHRRIHRVPAACPMTIPAAASSPPLNVHVVPERVSAASTGRRRHPHRARRDAARLESALLRSTAIAGSMNATTRDRDRDNPQERRHRRDLSSVQELRKRSVAGIAAAEGRKASPRAMSARPRIAARWRSFAEIFSLRRRVAKREHRSHDSLPLLVVRIDCQRLFHGPREPGR